MCAQGQTVTVTSIGAAVTGIYSSQMYLGGTATSTKSGQLQFFKALLT